jgi:hypothetical protein
MENETYKFCRYYAAYERNGERVIYAKTSEKAQLFGNSLFDVGEVIDEGVYFHVEDIEDIETRGWCWG